MVALAETTLEPQWRRCLRDVLGGLCALAAQSGGSQTTDPRDHNYVNEITQRAVTGSSPVVFQYDGATGASNGNLKNDGTLIYAYDALNRLIQANRVSDGLIIATYLCDAMNRRVRKTISNGGLTGSVPNSTTGTWGVTQRYVYSPYGTITVLNADWSTLPTGTQPLVNNLYQVPMAIGMDSVTGHYYARNRNYSPSLGTVSRQEPKSRLSAGAAPREINQDPAGYIDGANTYQFVMGNPVGKVDPWGLAVGHHIIPGQIYNESGLFNPQSPGYRFFKNFYTGKTDPNHGWSKAHELYTKAVKKLVEKWLKDHPGVNPDCPDFSEDNARAIADDVLRSDDPDIRGFLRNVLTDTVNPSKYFPQIANAFENAGGNIIAVAKPESVPAENMWQNVAANAPSNAPRDETLAQQAESLVQETENIIEADAAALEQGIEEVPK